MLLRNGNYGDIYIYIYIYIYENFYVAVILFDTHDK